MNKYTYLIINILVVLIPLLRSFESRIKFYLKWRYCFFAILVTGVLFVVWDYFKTLHGVWGFNDKYCMGYKLAGLPIEELLFFITVPYACIFIYEVVNLFFDAKIKDNTIVRYITWFYSLIFLCAAYFARDHAYTFTVLFIGGLVIPAASKLLKGNALNKFYITFCISLFPMLLVNGVLTALPIVIYNQAENLNIRLGSIPVEDFLYAEILLITNLAIYQWSKENIFSNSLRDAQIPG